MKGQRVNVPKIVRGEDREEREIGEKEQDRDKGQGEEHRSLEVSVWVAKFAQTEIDVVEAIEL